MGRGTTSAKAKVATKRVVAAKSATRKKAPAADDVSRRLAVTLAQQKATSEILRVMSESPGDVLPVLNAVSRHAGRLCDAPFARILLVDGDVLRHAADYSVRGRRVADPARPVPLRRTSISGRAALDRKTIHIPDIGAVLEREYPDARANARLAGFRTILAVPLVSEGVGFGALMVYRRVVRRFTRDQVALVETFGRQAAIAIGNVRLFRETKEALDRQSATSEILRVISGSPTDVQPVFDAIVRTAVRLCGADHSIAARFDGELLHPLAYHGFSAEALELTASMFPMRPTMQNMLGRAALKQAIDNLPDMLADPHYSREFAMAGGWRSGLAVPMLRDGKLIGAIAVSRKAPGAFSEHLVRLLGTFADQAVIAIENVRLFTELGKRNRDLSEALEQQTATSEILSVISASQTDVRPVFDTIVRSVLALCNATFSGVYLLNGETFSLAATAGLASAELARLASAYPRKIGPDTVSGRAALECRVVQSLDLMSDPDYSSAPGASIGVRTVLGVPMMRDGTAIGSIGVWHSEVRPFSDAQIALLQTFADQAVIAIENVRLFTELEQRNSALAESLEQQTATSEILRVISRSQTDVQPVFQTIADAVLRLCGATSANLLTFDGKLLRVAALANVDPGSEDAFRSFYPRAPGRETATTRAVLTRSVVEIPDVLEDSEYAMSDASLAAGFRSVLGIPLLREGNPIGAIAVGRPQPGPFTKPQIELVKTFADQAVIAIENVRLFTELQARNRDLSEALEQQTATSEILRVISASPRDVQPVFDAIARSVLTLCNARTAFVARFDGRQIELAALTTVDPQQSLAARQAFPRAPSRDNATARAILTGAIVVIPDVAADPDYAATVKPLAMKAGFRSTMSVPLIHGGKPIGAITVGRPEPGPFSDGQVELLRTFADQAVIAIENVRLFTELEAKTQQLTRSVGELKALGEVGQAVSSTLDLETVLSTIVTRATQLAGMDAGAVYEYDQSRELFFLHTADKYSDELIATLRATPIPKGEGAVGRLAVTREPVQVHDITDASAYHSRVRNILLGLGHRALLAVPLLREDHLLGGLIVNRKSAGEFAPHTIQLLQTFASQSALAIQNARLFREIEAKSRELETASRHKSEFLANMSHELRTPLNAIIGFSEVLSEKLFGDINAKQEEYIADILESGHHLLDLINDILDLSKIEAGRMELELTDFYLSKAVENALTLVRERASRHGIKLARVLDEDVGTVRGDERKVKQVLLNLLSNALKFTPEGGRVDVRVAARDGMVEVSVADTGVGIAPEDRDAVFEEFRQVGASAKKREGTGLGLAISRKFIELHGGRIWVDSQIGKGSTFTFTLPLNSASSPALH